MNLIQMTDQTRFLRVRLGEIQPNRFRDLVRWKVEREVVDALKASITTEGFWANLQAVVNEHNRVELRFGHHRWTAGLEIFGPDHEIALEIVPFRGEHSLLRAMHLENAVTRNRLKHTNEVVNQYMHWFDDEVFEQCPTWAACEQAGKIPRLDLERYFGKANENGPGNYAQSVKYGIGRRVLAKALEGSESEDNIEEALRELPPTARRKRGIELEIQEAKQEAEAQRKEAARLEEEQKKLADQAKQADQKKKEELKKAQQQKEKQAATAKEKAAKAEKKVKNKKEVITVREWFDARAAEVFDRSSHGAEFRRAVSAAGIREHLHTDDLLPFATAIREELERQSRVDKRDRVTAERIQKLVAEHYRTFKQGLNYQDKIITKEALAADPVMDLRRKLKEATTTAKAARQALGSLLTELNDNQVIATDYGLQDKEFTREFKRLADTITELQQFFTAAPTAGRDVTPSTPLLEAPAV